MIDFYKWSVLVTCWLLTVPKNCNPMQAASLAMILDFITSKTNLNTFSKQESPDAVVDLIIDCLASTRNMILSVAVRYIPSSSISSSSSFSSLSLLHQLMINSALQNNQSDKFYSFLYQYHQIGNIIYSRSLTAVW